MTKKTVVILGAGEEQLPLYHLCKKMSLNIIGVDKNKDSPGLKFSDYKLITSIRNDNNLVAKIKKIKKKISTVITVANDIPKIYYRISKELKTKNISKISAELSSDKEKLYNFLKKKKFNIPNFSIIKNKKDAENFLKKNKFPLILKPLDGRGSRGVYYIKNKNQLFYYMKNSFGKKRNKSLILQKFLKGIQISSETLVVNKKDFTILSERNYGDTKHLYPNVIENGGNIPFKPNFQTKVKIQKEIKRLIKLMRVNNFPLKCDLILKNQKIYFLEASPRFGGGFVASHVSKELYGLNFLETYLKILLGNKIHKINFKFKNKFSSIRFVILNKKGKVKKN